MVYLWGDASLEHELIVAASEELVANTQFISFLSIHRRERRRREGRQGGEWENCQQIPEELLRGLFEAERMMMGCFQERNGETLEDKPRQIFHAW